MIRSLTSSLVRIPVYLLLAVLLAISPLLGIVQPAGVSAAAGNTPESSTIRFQSNGVYTLAPGGDGTYTGVIPCMESSFFDIYAQNGSTAYFDDTPYVIIDHDAWPTWTPDTPDWYQYSLNLYVEDGVQKWALQNHAGATAENPWYTDSITYNAKGIPMSGTINWSTGYALETGTGAYLPATGTGLYPGKAASHGGGAGYWDMDWSWGSEAVPLQYPGFDISVTPDGSGGFIVTMVPSSGPVVNQTTGTSYGTINAAVTAATGGDTIVVGAGTYDYISEGSPAPAGLIKVTQGVTIKAADGVRPVIDGSGFDGVFKIHPSALNPGGTVIIEGFEITGDATTDTAITMQGCFDGTPATVIIRDNWFHGMNAGFNAWGAGNHCPPGWTSAVAGVQITNNKFYQLGESGETRGYGVWLEGLADRAAIGEVYATNVEGNEFYTIYDGAATDYGFAVGLQGGAANAYVANNSFTTVSIGTALLATDVADTCIESNDMGATLFGVMADTITNGPVDATGNWWGSADGPGTAFSGDVDYSPWLGAVPGTTPMTWYTNDSVQEAVNAATAGDTINVAAGTYIENIVVDVANLTITGAGAATTTIDGGGSGTVVTIAANGVTFSGFTVTGSGTNDTDAGIILNGVTGGEISYTIVTTNVNGIAVIYGSGNTILDNNINNNLAYGVLLIGSTGNTVESNTITNHNYDGIAFANAAEVGGSIETGSTGNYVRTNTITTARDGIFIGENCDGNFITNGNTVTNAASIGISVWRPSGQTITDNTITGGLTGIRLLGSSNNIVTGNIITGTTGTTPDGAALKVDASWQEGVWYPSQSNTIEDNKIYNNAFGVYAADEHQTIIVDATLNWWGAATGPTHANNPAGTGSTVSDNVLFDPWWADVDGSETASNSSLSHGIFGGAPYARDDADAVAEYKAEAESIAEGGYVSTTEYGTMEAVLISYDHPENGPFVTDRGGCIYIQTVLTGLYAGDIVRVDNNYFYNEGTGYESFWDQAPYWIEIGDYTHTDTNTINNWLIYHTPDGNGTYTLVIGSGEYNLALNDDDLTEYIGDQYKLTRDVKVYRGETLSNPTTSSRGYIASTNEETSGWGTPVINESYATPDLTYVGVQESYVDDAWADADNGDIVGEGYIFGQDAFASIQQAIDGTVAGGTVNVAAGTYNVSTTIAVDKSVTITGLAEGGAVVTGTNETTVPVFSVTSNGVTIQNLAITLTGDAITAYAATTSPYNGLIQMADGTTGTVIQNNTIWVPNQGGRDTMSTWAAFGVKFLRNTAGTVTGNTIYDTRQGISSSYGSALTITGNTIYNTKGGICIYTNLADIDNHTITGNSWDAPDAALSHSEWDIVWHTGGGDFTLVADWAAHYQTYVLALSGANNSAYVTDWRNAGDGKATENNRSHVFVYEGAINGEGGVTTPMNSINAAVTGVVPGGQVIVGAGTYNPTSEGRPISLETKGLFNITKGLTIKAATGTRPILDGSGIDGVIKIHPSALTPGSTVIIEGFEITGIPTTGIAITMQGCFDVTPAQVIIRDNWFHGVVGGIDLWGAGAYLPTGWTSAVTNVQITGNKFYELGVAGTQEGFGVMLEDLANWATAGNAHAALVQDNEFYDIYSKDGANPGVGVVIPRADEPHKAANANIVDNSFDNVGVGVAILDLKGTGVDLDVTNTIINYNSFTNIAGYGVMANDTANGPVDATRNWWGSADGDIITDKVAGDVTYFPWYTTAGMDTLATLTVVNIAAIQGVTAPVTGEAPVTTITETTQYTGTVTWTPADGTFVGGTVYTATITLTPKTGFTLEGVTTNFFAVAGASTTSNAADSGVVVAVFPETQEQLLVVDIAAIPGVTAPATGGTPVTEITPTAQYTGTVTWAPAHAVFQGETTYTATITLTPKEGYTFEGVTADFFTVAGATTDTNAADTGIVTAVFAATGPSVLETITVSPSTASTPAGSTVQFIATGTYTDNSTKDITSEVTWGSSNGDAATINNTDKKGRATAVAEGTTDITAALDSVTSNTAVLTVTAPTLTSIEITGATTVAAGQTITLALTGHYSDGTSGDVTTNIIWTSQAPANATVGSNTGVVTGTLSGTNAVIKATYKGFTATHTVAVTDPVLTGITVTPANPTVTHAGTLAFTAIGNYSDGSSATLTTGVTWTSGTPGTATIDTVTGVATTVAAGTTDITAAFGGVNGTTVLTVTDATLTGITITPATADVPKGKTQQYTATGTYSDTTQKDITSMVTWNSSAPGVATINAAGKATAVAGTGTTNITATLGDVTSDTAVLTAVPAEVVSIAVTPANSTLPDGRSRDFIATGTFSDGTTAVLGNADLTWSITNGTGEATNVTNRVTGTEQGNVTVNVQHTTPTTNTVINGSTPLTISAPVVESIAITGDNTVAAGGAINNLDVIATLSDGSPAPVSASAVTWTVSNPAAGSVSVHPTEETASVFQSTAQGSTNLVASVMGKTSPVFAITVTAPTVVSVSVDPVGAVVPAGTTRNFRAIATLSDGSKQIVTTQATWASNAEGVATVSTTGVVSGVATGTATISATFGGQIGQVNVTVSDGVLTGITVTPVGGSVAAGKTLQYTATGTYSAGPDVDITTMVVWSSSDTNKATVNQAGLATGRSVGTANIIAALGDISGQAAINVTPATLESITVNPATPTLTHISGAPPTLQFTATGIYSDGSTTNLTATATWASSNPAAATIDAAGLATTVNAGVTTLTTNITATSGGKTGTTVLTVKADTVAPKVIITSPKEGLTSGTRTIVVSGNINDVNVTDKELWVNGVKVVPNLTLDGNGNFNAGVTLNDGNNSIVVRAIDPAGNKGTSSTVTVKVDIQKPTITITSPVDGLLTNNTNVTITGTATHQDGVTDVNVVVNGVSTTVPVAGGAFTTTATLASGNNIISATGYATGFVGDASYLGASGARTVKVDITAPVVKINNPVNNSVVSVASQNIEGTIDDTQVTTARLSLNGSAPVTVTVVNGTFNTVVNLSNGENTISVTATDAANNTSSAGVLARVTLDTSKPGVTLTSPQNNLRTNAASQTIAGTVSDPTIETVTVTVNGTAENVPVIPDGEIGRFSSVRTMVEGNNTIEVTATNRAVPAQTGTSGVYTVTLDTTAPTATINLSDPTDVVTITVTSSESLQGLPAVVVNGTDVVMAASGGLQWTGTYEILAAGNYVVLATITDAAGNNASATASFAKSGMTNASSATVTSSSTTLQVETNGDVTGDISVATHLDNPAGNAGSPDGAGNAAGAYVEINADPDILNNLTGIYVEVNYDPAQLPAGTDESTLKLYLWDVETGTWKVVPGSGVDTDRHVIYATLTHLSKYGSFGGTTYTPPPPPPPVPGGGFPAPAPEPEPEVPAGTTDVRSFVSAEGRFNSAVSIIADDQSVVLEIPEGTVGLTADLEPIDGISMVVAVDVPAPPQGAHIIGVTWDFGPDGATFEPAVNLTMPYDPASLPDGVAAEDLVIAWYNTATCEWVMLETTVDTVHHMVTAKVSHFTTFGLVAVETEEPAVTPTTPAVTPTTPAVTPTTPAVTPTTPAVTSTTPAVTTTTQPAVDEVEGMAWWWLIIGIGAIAIIAIIIMAIRSRRD